MFTVYILECTDQTLYTGSTNDLKKRLHAHNFCKSGAKYTRARRPVKLVYSKKFRNRSLAAKAEAGVKKLARAEKMKLILK